MTDSSTKRICIIGGGFGGLYTALRLSQLPWEPTGTPEIVLVDRSDRFLFSPLLYELLTGELRSWEIAPTFSEVLADTGVRFLQAAVTGIDLNECAVHSDGGDLPWDELVLALGGTARLDRVPGAAEHAIPFRNLGDAYRLEERLRQLEEADRDVVRVAIVGGGYSGVEVACKLADRLRERGRIRIIDRGDTILQSAADFNRTAARKALDTRQVWVDLETSVDEIAADRLAMSYKGQRDEIPVDLVLWTTGTRASELIAALPFERDDFGRLFVEPTLQVRDRETICQNLFALGDLATCRDASGQQVPHTAQAAIQQADYCAWNLWATLTGRPLLPFRYQHLGEMMVLGVNDAALSGLGVQLDGPLAYLSRRLVYLGRMPTLKHQFAVGANWMTQPMLDLMAS
ncbi:NADH dehydrogenase, FAD-containing subunit [Rubidibacter lacunae KORDI 51-2]|uniref:demethylphylloquinone reductase n=1 Tax=Rubidibacter lacunae KORDI 51-2 TaxID=582515 RepID=U5DG83_9CHRO|nr:NAD(P)/FAD-dependent oxidoreductase [Rubidibacter lacunae]ERN40282.1 NADH dehydrogenase, FAD-containing subunit [Rubidibacter lacunae KORDI 51-2]